MQKAVHPIKDNVVRIIIHWSWRFFFFISKSSMKSLSNNLSNLYEFAQPAQASFYGVLLSLIKGRESNKISLGGVLTMETSAYHFRPDKDISTTIWLMSNNKLCGPTLETLFFIWIYTVLKKNRTFVCVYVYSVTFPLVQISGPNVDNKCYNLFWTWATLRPKYKLCIPEI